MRDYSQGGKPMGDYTQWTVFRDHANKVYFWRSYEGTGLKSLDLKTVDFSAGQPMRSLPVQQREASGRDAVAGAVRRRDAIASGGRLCLRWGAG